MSTAMSTAFMVDSILQDKDSPGGQVSSSPVGGPPGASIGDGSLASISDSDEFDEPKDTGSLCDSPKSFHSLHHHHLHHHHHPNHPAGDQLHHLHHHHLLQHHHHHHHHHQRSGSFSDDELPAGPPSINGGSIGRRPPTFRGHSAVDDGLPLEQMDFCCAKCGHCQPELNPGSRASPATGSVGGTDAIVTGAEKRVTEGENNNNNNNNRDGKDDSVSPEGGTGEAGSEFEFRCEKCGFGEYVVPGKQTTILKENTKPVLKFSVSAILGDKKDCVKVRNDNKIIAKPLPSRPTPFLHHSLNHPHLHSLLAHCRNPYMPGGPQVFPLPPGQGFPWAHSTRGKPRRGMMRRAVFSDSQRKGLEKRFQLQKYISKPDRKKLAERLGLKDSQVKRFEVSVLEKIS
uniref:Homeobox domain-containing protein n=1 Tax=Anopheles farauti TaxID=69004 RepID=A0A182QTE2_9DIPT